MNNKRFFSGWLAGMSFLLLSTASCSKEHMAMETKTSLTGAIARDSSLTIFNAAIQRAQLAGILSDGGPYTIFAPVDSAFLAEGLTLEKVRSYDVDSLGLLLRYHIVEGRISGENLLGFFQQPLSGLHPSYQPTITKNYYGIFINGIKAIGEETTTYDGAVQRIGRIAFPPAGNLLDIIRSHPELSLLAAMLGKENYNLQRFVTEENITLLAPTDKALLSAGITADSISRADSITVDKILLNYIADSAHFSPEFIDRHVYLSILFRQVIIDEFDIYGYENIHPLRPDQSGFVTYDGSTIVAVSSPRNPRIVRPDIVGTNGVLHLIDGYIFQAPNLY